jgi:hypothetical protein
MFLTQIKMVLKATRIQQHLAIQLLAILELNHQDMDSMLVQRLVELQREFLIPTCRNSHSGLLHQAHQVSCVIFSSGGLLNS